MDNSSNNDNNNKCISNLNSLLTYSPLLVTFTAYFIFAYISLTNFPFKSKCYQKSNIFKISWQQLKNQFGS